MIKKRYMKSYEVRKQWADVLHAVKNGETIYVRYYGDVIAVISPVQVNQDGPYDRIGSE